MRKFFLLLAILFQAAIAQNFNFNSSGESSANRILKEYIQKEYDIDDVDTVAYFYNSKIVGIVKHSIFYSLEGYKLIVLDVSYEEYKPVKCDISFDNTLEFSIDDNEITFYKSQFYKNKKYKATIKNNEIRTNMSPNNLLTSRKVRCIEELTRPVKNEKVNNFALSDFNASPERNVNIRYKNLNEKTKHYLNMQ